MLYFVATRRQGLPVETLASTREREVLVYYPQSSSFVGGGNDRSEAIYL